MVKIFVGNVHDSARGDDLRELFAKYGRVTESDVVDGKGFGFVHMETQDEADAAVAGLNGTDLKGRSINVELSTGKPKGSKFPGGRSGDRGGGRRGMGGGRGPPRGGRDYYGGGGGPRRDYGGAPPDPPRGRYGDMYGGGGGRYPPDPYDRNGYYSRGPAGGGGGYPPRDARDRYDSSGRSMMMPMSGGYGGGGRSGGYDMYERRAPMSGGGMDGYARGADPYAPRGVDPYGRDPYAARSRMSPPRGGGYYDRRAPSPPMTGGYGGGGGYGMGARPRSPMRAAPASTRYGGGDMYERRPSGGRSPPRAPYGGGSRY